MSSLEIDTAATRQAVRHLSFAHDGLRQVGGDVTRAAAGVELDRQHRMVVVLVREVHEELGRVGRILGLTADAADVADSGFSALVDTWISASLGELEESINDGTGATVRSLLSDPGTDPATALDAILSLSDRAAERWFGSLSETQRTTLVAVHPSWFRGTPVEGPAQAWMDDLGAAGLRQLFTTRALHRAGIDPSSWQPSLGLDANRHNIEHVYEYYADIYRSDTDHLWWSGMAALIGPSFYGGFQDLDTFSDLLDAAAIIQGGPVGSVLPGGIVPNQLTALGERQLADELDWYQLRLLSMQQEIFYDMAPAHEAFLDGGADMVERLYADDPVGYGPETIAAWRDIETGGRTGDTHLIARGNEILLRREQQFVISDDYDRMRARAITGEAVTYMMTAVGAPSVPGAASYPEVFPASIDVSRYVGTPRSLPEPPLIGGFLPDVPLPHLGVEGTLTVDTPLPSGNIADFDDRWNLIREDTLPVYVDLALHHPDHVLDVLSVPVGERAEAFTIKHRLDDLIADAFTNWDVDLDLDLEAGL